MRLFIAVNLPLEERRAMFAAAQPLRAAAPGASWVRAENLHVTIKFLGEVAEERVTELRTALSEAVAPHRAFALALGGAGAFPNLRAPRVVWMGAAPEPRLELVHHDIESACAALGYPVEGRPFRPHVTLGRVKKEHPGRDAARALGDAARRVHYEGEVEVVSVDLMRSTLAPGGSQYALVHSALLGDR
ncbi:MAG TPA: RNA 2',3'-cyclic phosphodiesterase [Gemmatimonadaceae bacterium]|nr:RNA 2',3'-cyclic phosphodiesterase [Gemmatimonadaceae bacterium]